MTSSKVLSKPARRQITNRDLEILSVLDRTPLTVQQLLKLSRVFEHQPFTHVRSVQDRLNKLRQAGWIRSWPYARASRGTAPDYFKLTSEGLAVLYGPNYPAPKKRHFSEIAVGLHQHTHALAEIVVHLHVAAQQAGARLVNYYRENSLRLEAGSEVLYPDAGFELHTDDGRQFNFLLELDNATETIRSPKDIDSWQRKIRIYHTLQDQVLPRRFRVLVVTTRSSERLQHILQLSADESPDPRRSLFYGAAMPNLLKSDDPINERAFVDHRSRPVPLVPRFGTHDRSKGTFRRDSLAPLCGVC